MLNNISSSGTRDFPVMVPLERNKKKDTLFQIRFGDMGSATRELETHHTGAFELLRYAACFSEASIRVGVPPMPVFSMALIVAIF